MSRYDYNSVVNQNIKGNFVDREVIACQSALVDELLKRGVFSYDDIENLYEPEDEETAERLNRLINALDNALERVVNDKGIIDGDREDALQTKREKLEEQLRELDTKPQEIYEWYLVGKMHIRASDKA